MNEADLSPVDVLIIGGGQAGLAMGAQLKATHYSFRLVDSQAQIGDSWRLRYDSLRLFTPRAFSALPGYPLAGDPYGWADKDEFASYLEAYAAHFDLPVALNTVIQRLERPAGAEHFRALPQTGPAIAARAVVIATGGFQEPIVPAIGAGFAASVKQLSATSYRRPSLIPTGTVLVVGDGPTGRDAAAELAATHPVLLATGRSRRLLPDRILGASTWWWLDKLGLLRVPGHTPLGRLMQRTDPFPARGQGLPQLAKRGIRIMPRLKQADGQHAQFENGEVVKVDTVVWAIGYRDRSDWVALPEAKDERGKFIHQQGVSPVNGLYFIGRPWQRNRASALIYGVGTDAAVLVNHLTFTRASRNA